MNFLYQLFDALNVLILDIYKAFAFIKCHFGKDLVFFLYFLISFIKIFSIDFS